MNGNISIEFHQDIGGVDVTVAFAEWPCVPRVGESVFIRATPSDADTRGKGQHLTVTEVSWGWRVTGTGERMERECVAIVTVGAHHATVLRGKTCHCGHALEQHGATGDFRCWATIEGGLCGCRRFVAVEGGDAPG